MTDHYFICYSSVDGKDFAVKLADEVAAGPPPIPVWVDARKLRPGEDCDEQIVEAIKTCKGMMFVMTLDSVRPDSVCKNEWVRGLRYKKPIIPLRLVREAELPLRLESCKDIDFTGSFENALARLRKHLSWMDSPPGQLQALNYRLADAQRELPRAEPEQRARIRDDIVELEQQIARQQAIVDNPQAAEQRAERSIEAGLEGARKPATPVSGITHNQFINQPPMVAPPWFQDRHVETQLIGDFLKDNSLRLMTVVGRAGIGKTAMVCRLLKSLENGRLPDDGEPLSVDGIVYLCATGSRRVRLPHLYASLCQLLPKATARLLDGVYKNPHSSTEDKIQALLEVFPGGRTVVLLDNFEDVVDTATGEVRDGELDEALRTVLTLPQHAVKVILTTRVAPRTLLLVQPGRQMILELDKGLDSPYAENILRAMDKDGKVGLRDAPEPLLAEARERTRGYPRALEALVAILKADRDTTLEEVLSDAQRLLPERVVEKLVGEAFSRLDPIAQRVMQALAVYPYPVSSTAVDYLLQPYLPGVDSTPVLRRLVNMLFARREAGLYYLHHVDRAYALSRVPDGRPVDWRGPEPLPYTRPSLLHRGAEYFRKVRRDESTWRSVEDLIPLIAEFDLLFVSGDDEGALEVLETMLPFLEEWRHYRLVERLADRLASGGKEPFRSMASGVAGLAHSALGEYPQAIEHLKTALQAPPPEVDSAQLISWRLGLAECYSALGDHYAAAKEYYHIYKNTEESDVETQVEALLGLGFVAEAHSSFAEAEDTYLQALQVYVPQLSGQLVSEGEKMVLSPGALPPDLPITNPWAWHPLDPLVPAAEPEAAKVLYLFNVEKTSRQHVLRKLPTSRKRRRATERPRVELSTVRVTANLAHIWMSLAGLCARTDHVPQAGACCRLALIMYQELEMDLGVARALDLLRRLTTQLSDAEAEAMLATQEDWLRYARDSSNRRLEITLLNDLAECYLTRNKVGDAEALYEDLLRYAKELDDPSLQAQAEFGLARIEWVRERPDVAVAKLEELLQSRPQDLKLHTEVVFMLGQIEQTRNQRDVATSHLLSASRGYAALGSLRKQVEAECQLALLDQDRRNYEEAVKRLRSALQLAKPVGIPSLITSVLCKLARAYFWAGARDQALATADEASKIASEIELPSTAAEALAEQAKLYGALGDEARSRDAFEKALALLDQTKDLQLKAEILLGRAEYAQAVDLYDRVIELGSIDPQTLSAAFSGKGWALQCQGKTKAPEAKKAYEKALAIYETLGSFPGRFRALLNLASLSSSTGDNDAAFRYLEQALNLARENKRLSEEAEALAEQAKLYGALGDEARSRDAFEKALALLDQIKNLQLKAEILLGRADAHADVAEYAQAVDLYDRVIELGSIDPQTLSAAFSGKGWALQGLGKTKAPEAKEAYEKALAIYETLGSFPGRFRALLNLASLSSSTGDNDAAFRYLEQALNLARENKRLSEEAEALAEQAKLQGALGDEARSRDAFEKALALLDQIKNLQLKAEILLGRADAHADVAEYAQAVDLYDRVIELGSIDPQTLSKAFFGKGWALLCMGKPKASEAKEAYEKAAELSPDNLWSHKETARALRLCGEDQAACDKDQWVIDQFGRQRRSREDLSYLGWCLYHLGRFEEAEEIYRQVVTWVSDPVSDFFDLGLILFCRGNIPEALAAYEKGLGLIRTRYPQRSRLGLLHVARSDLQEAIECHPSLSHLQECHRVFRLLQEEWETAVETNGS